MKKTFSKFVATVATTLWLSSCATKSAEQSFVETSGSQNMTSEQLQAVFDKNTFSWASGSFVYYDGSEVRGRTAKGKLLNGSVKLENDQHCRDWGKGEKCSTVYDTGDGTFRFFDADKAAKSGGHGKILVGNPQGL